MGKEVMVSFSELDEGGVVFFHDMFDVEKTVCVLANVEGKSNVISVT